MNLREDQTTGATVSHFLMERAASGLSCAWRRCRATKNLGGDAELEFASSADRREKPPTAENWQRQSRQDAAAERNLGKDERGRREPGPDPFGLDSPTTYFQTYAGKIIAITNPKSPKLRRR